MSVLIDGTAGITTPDLTDTSLTSGRVVYAGASGNLTGSTNLTFDGANLTCGGTVQALGTVQSSSGADLSLNANGANRDVIVKVNGTEQARFVGSTSVLSIISGIQFPATQVASSNANTLDDYEEGTFTPTIYGTSTAGTTTYFQQAGTYTKIGRVVTVQVFLNITNQTGTGSLRLGGLPFTSGSGGNTFPCSVRAENLALTALYYPVFSVQGANTYINMEQTPTGGGAIFGIAIDTSFSVDVTATYFV